MKYGLLVLAMVASELALAHTQLSLSVPAKGATVAAPVAELKLEFGGDVRLTAVSVRDALGHELPVAAPPTEVSSKFALALPEPLAEGMYVVTWRAVGADTHIVSGDFKFSVSH